MPRSFVRTFTDPYDFEHAVRAAEVTGYVTERGDFRNELVQIDLHRLWMQAGSESLGRSIHIAMSASRSPILFLASSNQASIRQSGLELHPGQIAFFAPGASHYQASSSASHWASMSLTPEDLAAQSQALLGRNIAAPKVTRVLKPERSAMERLVALHSAARHLARTAPERLAHPEVARAMEHALVHAMIACLGGSEDVEFSRGWRHHLKVMARFEQWLAANGDRPAYLAEICAALGVSQRTLNLCCREHLGVSPTRYLWLRRMHLTRHSLSRAEPAETTVSTIAMNHGFWELGRFSVAYRRLFGESPRETLRTPHHPRPQPSRSPFAFAEADAVSA